MRQQAFEARHGALWEELDQLLRLLEQEQGGGSRELQALPPLYRRACHHLALARERHYSAGLVERLNELVLRGHQRLYGARSGVLQAWRRFLGEFPRRLRAHWRAALLSAALLYGPFAGLTLAVQRNPELAYLVEDPRELAKYEAMYQSGKEKFGRKEASDTDVAMFGFYVWNNVRIDFQTFAGGLLAGLGTIFFQLLNGLHGGAVAGHLTRVGLGLNFWSFVITHSALELTGSVVSGAAGLVLAWGLLFPGRRSRLQSLKEAAKEALVLVYGAAAMTFLAAFFEAFWSSSALIAPTVKFAVGGGLWALVLGYLLLGGRGRA